MTDVKWTLRGREFAHCNALQLADSHAHFYDLHMNQSGVVRS